MVSVTDNVFLHTLEKGLVRPSDCDGLTVLCEGKEYIKCTVTENKFRGYTTLFLSNGITIETKNDTKIKLINGEYQRVYNAKANSTLYSEKIKFPKPTLYEPYDLSILTDRKSGEFDIYDFSFAKLAGIFAVAGKQLANGQIRLKFANMNFLHKTELILNKFNCTYIVDRKTIKVFPNWLTDVLKSCFGNVLSKSADCHYIPDEILLNAHGRWVDNFVLFAQNGYSKITMKNGKKKEFYYGFAKNSLSFVNDFAYLLQKSHNYKYRFILLDEGNFNCAYKYKKTLSTDTLVKLIKGIDYTRIKTCYDINLVNGESKGIYTSGLYIK